MLGEKTNCISNFSIKNDNSFTDEEEIKDYAVKVHRKSIIMECLVANELLAFLDFITFTSFSTYIL